MLRNEFTWWIHFATQIGDGEFHHHRQFTGRIEHTPQTTGGNENHRYTDSVVTQMSASLLPSSRAWAVSPVLQSIAKQPDTPFVYAPPTPRPSPRPRGAPSSTRPSAAYSRAPAKTGALSWASCTLYRITRRSTLQPDVTPLSNPNYIGLKVLPLCFSVLWAGLLDGSEGWGVQLQTCSVDPYVKLETKPKCPLFAFLLGAKGATAVSSGVSLWSLLCLRTRQRPRHFRADISP